MSTKKRAPTIIRKVIARTVRLPPTIDETVERLAGDERRSIVGQIEVLIAEALKARGLSQRAAA